MQDNSLQKCFTQMCNIDGFNIYYTFILYGQFLKHIKH